MPRYLRETAELNLYRNKNTIKILVGLIAILIVVVSVYYNNFIVNILKEREHERVDMFARAIEFMAEQGDNANLTFINEQIVRGNTTIPVILADQSGEPTGAYLNLDIPDNLPEAELLQLLRDEIAQMRTANEPIQVVYRNTANQVEYVEWVFYHNSDLLRQLSYYPFIQLSTILLFGALAYLAFSFSRTAEQNRIWVGLAKETAHQLGTPLSSLMAWLEYLRADERTRQHEALPEMAKDLEKLHMITERFSNIGSVPILEHNSVPEMVQNSVTYLQKRISTKVKITISSVGNDLRAQLNPHLFSWVIENLIKNAVDAMSGIGTIDIRIAPASNNTVHIDITDNGKGISKANIKKVFEPGFTTKKRGWGLGLTLAKRIIEHYHGGRIYVKHSEPSAGTTFRIVLRA
ncbi:sensor histidine kinase [Cesiribacter andamanensis]|uniref:histidine kinase n=1 Tax=Cesiribacter andamanensis AMV16 TaxID=1279009 RepID=M7N4Y8_9BACT|nr:ATP-binding protein [Cesiribacter andamanensis]EMR02362.1 Sensor protein ZraS [Cesiribacter andamanensis AMV16]